MSSDFLQLGNELREIGDLHQCRVQQVDYAHLKPVFDTLRQTAYLTHSNLSVYDLHRHTFLLSLTESPTPLMNPVLAWKAGILPVHYNELIHPDDLVSLVEGHVKAYRLVDSLPPDKKLGTTLCCLFRIRDDRGNYRLVCSKMAVFRLDRARNPWLLLNYSALLSECAAKEVPSGYCLGFIDQHAEPSVFTCNDISVRIISEHELQVLGLIVAGYENYQIAELMNIKMNTVNKHRQNLERHLGAFDMPQAVVFALRLGLA